MAKRDPPPANSGTGDLVVVVKLAVTLGPGMKGGAELSSKFLRFDLHYRSCTLYVAKACLSLKAFFIFCSIDSLVVSILRFWIQPFTHSVLNLPFLIVDLPFH